MYPFSVKIDRLFAIKHCFFNFFESILVNALTLRWNIIRRQCWHQLLVVSISFHTYFFDKVGEKTINSDKVSSCVTVLVTLSMENKYACCLDLYNSYWSTLFETLDFPCLCIRYGLVVLSCVCPPAFLKKQDQVFLEYT